MFHCRLCRGAEGGEAGWRVAVNEYMHTSFTEASVTVCTCSMSDVFTVYCWTMFYEMFYVQCCLVVIHCVMYSVGLRHVTVVQLDTH